MEQTALAWVFAGTPPGWPAQEPAAGVLKGRF